MNNTHYFSFRYEDAFRACHYEGMRLVDGVPVLETDGEVGYFVTPMLDSGAAQNRWQRLLADVELPQGSHIAWRFYTSDHGDAARRTWELWQDRKRDGDGRPMALAMYTIEGAEDWNDFLPLHAKGRYLSAAAILTRSSLSPPPRILSLCLYAAWESFMQYLPEIYRGEDSFLERFLRLFSAPFLDLEQAIEQFPGSLDPRVAPPDRLRWLASVIGIPHIDAWETEKLRGLLTAGTYRRKGRIAALPELVELFTGFCPFIAEHFRHRTGNEENDRHYNEGDLSIFLPPEALVSEIRKDALHNIVRSFLPVGVGFCIRSLDAVPALGDYAYLGINARVGDYAGAHIGDGSRLDYVILGNGGD